MKDLPIYFVSGMPRSGSTLLMNFLGQNPSHHVTPTNDVIDIIANLRDTWMNMQSFKSQGLDNIQPRIESSMNGVLEGFYREEFNSGKIVFDKSRGWFSYIELLEIVLQRPVKIITTVRDVRDVCASFEKIHRKSAMTRFGLTPEARVEAMTVEGRTAQLLSPGGVVGSTINRFRDVFSRGLDDRLIIIPYNRLTADPKKVMNQLHDVLELPKFDYDPRNVQQITHEDDTVHGMKLHEIRKEIKPQGPTWEGILPAQVCQNIENAYTDINGLSQS